MSENDSISDLNNDKSESDINEEIEKEELDDVEEGAPKLVLIHGPPKSGKTTLIKSLIKHYTGVNLKDPKGPITFRSGKRQRITLIEAPNSLNKVCELAKIADIVLTIVDASLGFEMDTFEFLSILQIHGFPKLMGITTHLDFIKDIKQLKKTRYKLKKRFQVEISKESKLFFIKGMSKNELYDFRDVQNIARYLSIIEPRELEFKNTHPHFLIDRFELLTEGNINDDTKVDVSLFGYSRGLSFIPKNLLKIVSYGEFNIDKIKLADDPCPIYLKSIKQGNNESDYEEIKKRTLKKNEKMLYAPQCNIGGITLDDTGGYFNLPDKHIVFTKIDNEDEDIKNNEAVKIIRDLQKNSKNIDKKINETELELVEGVTIKEEKNINNIEIKNNNENIVNEISKLTYNINLNNPEKIKTINLEEIIYSTTKTESYDCSRFFKSEYNNEDFYKSKIKEMFKIVDEFEDNEEEDEEYEKEKIQKNLEIIKSYMTPKEYIELNEDMITKGSYVQIRIKNIDFKQFKNFSQNHIIGCIPNFGEDRLGFLLVKLKKHRFYSNILKSNDPLIISSNFDKFQTIPYFAKNDLGERYRFIKYTPQWDYTYMICYGRFQPNNTGITCFQTMKENLSKFRTAATGIVIGFGDNFEIKKKLKLIGEPYKIYKNTALVTKMFNSDLEIIKFTNARIKTVSGIRGTIKKPVKEGPEGTFRATFEDKIVNSDIIFCRTWINLNLEKFYNPINLFDEDNLMKTTWELRKALGMKNPNHKNSYKPIERPNKIFTPIIIPKKIEQNLPFKTKTKMKEHNIKKQIEDEENKNVKIIKSDKEKEAYFFVQRLKLIEKEKKKVLQEKKNKKKEWKNNWNEGQKKGMNITKKIVKKKYYDNK